MTPTPAAGQHPVIRADGNYFGAVRRRFVVGGLHISETVYDAGAHIPPHQHECPSLFMPLGGRFVEGCVGDVRCYEAGDVGYHPPYEPHWLQTHGTGARGFAVEIGSDWRRVLGNELTWDAVPRNLSRSRVSWLLGRLHLELYMHDTVRSLAVEALGVELGAELHATRTYAARRPPRWFAAACDALRDRLHERVTLAELSSAAEVTPVAVIKAFRRHAGCTPGEYVRLLRLDRARRALAANDRPLSAIALDAGFYDQGHFSRAFKAAIGVPPSRYRRILRAEQ